MCTFNQRLRNMFTRAAPAFILLFISIIANAEQDGVDKLDISHLKHPSENVYTAGQPTAEQLKALSNYDVKHVINLRTPGEIDWDEAQLASKLGIDYHALPINGKTDITFENASKLQTLLAQVKQDKTLLHCGSSNRVGALIALDAYSKNKDTEQAIQIGKDWGLKGLEQHVRAVITEKNESLK